MRCLQGDLVQLKEMPSGVSNELKGKALDHLMMAHGLRHENINPFIGKSKLVTILRTSACCWFFVLNFCDDGLTKATANACALQRL